jgi:hypothetical protein
VSAPTPLLTEALGWAATAVFVASYFFTRAEVLVRVQMVGALMWVGYGVLMGAPPVVVANVLVLGAAAWQSRRRRRVEAAAPEGLEGQPLAVGAPEQR